MIYKKETFVSTIYCVPGLWKWFLALKCTLLFSALGGEPFYLIISSREEIEIITLHCKSEEEEDTPASCIRNINFAENQTASSLQHFYCSNILMVKEANSLTTASSELGLPTSPFWGTPYSPDSVLGQRCVLSHQVQQHHLARNVPFLLAQNWEILMLRQSWSLPWFVPIQRPPPSFCTHPLQ